MARHYDIQLIPFPQRTLLDRILGRPVSDDAASQFAQKVHDTLFALEQDGWSVIAKPIDGIGMYISGAKDERVDVAGQSKGDRPLDLDGIIERIRAGVGPGTDITAMVLPLNNRGPSTTQGGDADIIPNEIQPLLEEVARVHMSPEGRLLNEDFTKITKVAVDYLAKKHNTAELKKLADEAAKYLKMHTEVKGCTGCTLNTILESAVTALTQVAGTNLS